MVRSLRCAARLPGFKSQLHHLLAKYFQINSVTSLYITKMGKTILLLHWAVMSVKEVNQDKVLRGKPPTNYIPKYILASIIFAVLFFLHVIQSSWIA